MSPGKISGQITIWKIGNGNMNGAKSLLNKCTEKFKLFSGIHRDIDVNQLLDEISEVKKAYEKLGDAKDFDWSFVPKLD